MQITRMLLPLFLAAGACFGGVGAMDVVIADECGVLPINGSFLGAPSGHSPAPGWTLTPDGGSARALLGTDSACDGVLELRAAPGRDQSLVSDFFPVNHVKGCKMKIEAREIEYAAVVSHAGMTEEIPTACGFRYLCEFFDDSRTRLLRSDGIVEELPLPRHGADFERISDSTVKTTLNWVAMHPIAMPPETRFVRLRLTARAGSIARFHKLSAIVIGQSQDEVFAALYGRQIPALAPAQPGAIPAAPRPLPINGDFRGAATGHSPVPGWTLAPGKGAARVLPTRTPNQFVLEVQAPPDSAQVVVSDFFPVSEGWLSLKSRNVSSTSAVSLGCEVYDVTRTHLLYAPNSGRAFTPRPPISILDEIFGDNCRIGGTNFDLLPQARFVRIRLTAMPGAIARFRGVTATYSPTPPIAKDEISGASEPPAPAAPPTPQKAIPLMFAPEPEIVPAPEKEPAPGK